MFWSTGHRMSQPMMMMFWWGLKGYLEMWRMMISKMKMEETGSDDDLSEEELLNWSVHSRALGNTGILLYIWSSWWWCSWRSSSSSSPLAEYPHHEKEECACCPPDEASWSTVIIMMIRGFAHHQLPAPAQHNNLRSQHDTTTSAQNMRTCDTFNHNEENV